MERQYSTRKIGCSRLEYNVVDADLALLRYFANVEEPQNKTYSSRAKHVALRLFYIRDKKQQGKTSIHHILTELNIADIGTKFLSKHPHRYLIGLINNFKA